MPEPRCTCCHVLNRVELWNNTAVMALLDWHDTPFRENKRRWKGGPEVYRRCLVIYDAAKGITDAEVHRDDQVQPGS